MSSLTIAATAGLIVAISAALVIARSRSFDVSPVWPLFALFLPLAVATANLKLGVLPVFSDAQFYDQLAWDTALAWQQGQLIPESFHNLRTQAYASIVAIVYLLSGRAPFLAIVLNVGLWGLAVCYWLRLNREAFGTDSPVLGVLLVVYPAGIIYGSSFLREAVMALFLAIALLHLFRWIQHRRSCNLVVGGLSSALLTIFRPETLPLLLISFCFVLALDFDLFNNLSRVKRGAIIVVTGGFTIAPFLIANVSGYYNPFRVGFLEAKRQNLAQYSYSYLDTLSYGSWIDVALYLPIRVFYFLFQPFPWYPSNYHLTFATVDALFLLLVVPLAVLGVTRYWSELSAEHMLLLTFALLSIVGYSLVVSTKGAVTRRRLLSVPILLLFANLALPRIRLVYRSRARD